MDTRTLPALALAIVLGSRMNGAAGNLNAAVVPASVGPTSASANDLLACDDQNACTLDIINGSKCTHAPHKYGDLNNDKTVDLLDLTCLLDGFAGANPTCPPGTLDLAPCWGDARVDLFDILAVLDAYQGLNPCGCGSLEVSWIHGSPNCSQDPNPPIQVHQYNDDTFILRQNKCVNFEGPFIYLLFGQDKVFMQDTGATSSATLFPIRATVQGIINQWLLRNGRPSIQLIVTHSHGHGDHVAGDGQFIGQPNTTVVGTSAAAVQNFFGITSWPTQIVSYDLGGRILDIIPIPGHQTAHIAVYDRSTRWLLTGDTLYPGRLYISSWAAYQASIQRMVDFVATHPISYCMGTHIEMSTTPGDDYPIGTTYQPNEHELPLDLAHLLELNTAVAAMGNNPVYQVHDDFIIFPL